MAYKITDARISCGAREGACPVGAISQGEDHYEINPDMCIECGACSYICPGRLHLTHSFKVGKQKVKEAAAKAKAAAEAAKAAEEAKKEA